MTKMKREDIHIIARHSNWSAERIDTFLKKEIYNDSKAWYRFLKLLFISLGVGFTTAGIVFFFAYNWDHLHKFLKIGLIEGLLMIATLVLFLSKGSSLIKNIVLTAISVLTGVLFAVFGQIYQTGANAYDFFLSWTIAIALWVVVSNFAPLWLLFITLVNTTYILYIQQVAHGWHELIVFILPFLINVVFLVATLLLKNRTSDHPPPNWFVTILALAATSFATLGCLYATYELHTLSSYAVLFIITTLVCYSLGMLYALKHKNTTFIALIALSLLISSAGYLFYITIDEGTFFLTCLFIIGGVTLIIQQLINLQKKWNH